MSKKTNTEEKVEEIVEETVETEHVELTVEEENVKLKEEVAFLKDQLLRNMAEVENFKKRINDERIKDRMYASQGLVTDIITVLDSLNIAVNSKVEDENLKNFLLGFKMINDQLFQALESNGLSRINALGEQFDPNLHQSVAQESDDTKESGVVLEELKAGYKYKDRVIVPTMVKVNE